MILHPCPLSGQIRPTPTSSYTGDTEDREPAIDKPAISRGYLTSYPRYLIYPHRIVERDGVVVVLGYTTGSHLDLPDNDEAKLTVIWRAQVTNGLLTTWEIKEDTPAQRAKLGLPATGDA